MLPLYAGDFGVGYGLVGAAVSAMAAARVFFDLPGGRLADRFGRRGPATLGLLIIASAGTLMGVAPSFGVLIAARVLEGLGSALFITVTLTHLAKAVGSSERGRVMSAYMASFLTGDVVGPLVGGFVASEWGRRAPFFLYAALAAACSPLVFFAIHKEGAVEKRLQVSIGRVLSSETFAIILLTAFAMFFSRAGVRRVLIPLFAEKNLGLSEFEIGLVLSAAALATAPTIMLGGHISDRYGRKAALYPSLLLSAAAVTLLPTARDVEEFVLFAMLYGVTVGLAGPLAAFAADVVPPETVGLAMGIYRAAGDLGFLTGPLTLGFLAEFAGNETIPVLPFHFAAGMLLLCTVLLPFTKEAQAGSE